MHSQDTHSHTHTLIAHTDNLVCKYICVHIYTHAGNALTLRVKSGEVCVLFVSSPGIDTDPAVRLRNGNSDNDNAVVRAASDMVRVSYVSLPTCMHTHTSEHPSRFCMCSGLASQIGVQSCRVI